MIPQKRIYCLLLVLFSVQLFSQQGTGNPPEIQLTGNRDYCRTYNERFQVIATVSITDNDSSILDEVSVQISENYERGSDLLELSQAFAGITVIWLEETGRLKLVGPASLTVFENALLSVVYSTSSSTPIFTRTFTTTLGDALYLEDTDHYYEFVESVGITWEAARDAAAARSYYGLKGYLTTLTSEVEANFAGSRITGTGWIGATDNAVEGEWRWVTGPEAGLLFWNGNETGSVVPGQFAFWNTGEPNDFPDAEIPGQENYAHITDNSIGIRNSWNDIPTTGGGGVFDAVGYIVEYGGSPGDPVLNLSGATTVTLKCLAISNRQQTFRVDK